MPTKAKFNLDEVFKGLTDAVDKIVDLYLLCLKSALIDTVTAAKNLDTYKNQTGNLRSSIGYVIYNKGQKVAEYFERVIGPKGAEADTADHGTAAGLKVATEAAEQYPDKIVGVIVAGEDYALAVESKGFDVITGPCTDLNKLLEKYIKEAISVYLE